MNFSLKVKESAHIFSIKNILRDRHGRMDDLKICFKAFTESSEVKNDMLTLLGKYGSYIPHIIIVFYFVCERRSHNVKHYFSFIFHFIVSKIGRAHV